jgi:hypothetical protein
MPLLLPRRELIVAVLPLATPIEAGAPVAVSRSSCPLFSV